MNISLPFQFSDGDEVTPGRIHEYVDRAYVSGIPLSSFTRNTDSQILPNSAETPVTPPALFSGTGTDLEVYAVSGAPRLPVAPGFHGIVKLNATIDMYPGDLVAITGAVDVRRPDGQAFLTGNFVPGAVPFGRADKYLVWYRYPEAVLVDTAPSGTFEFRRVLFRGLGTIRVRPNLVDGYTAYTGPELSQPQAIAADASYVYICDTSHNAVKRYPNNFSSYINATGFNAPRGICVWKDHVYVAEYGGGKIYKLTKDLVTVKTVATGHALGQCAAGLAALYVADPEGNTVRIYDEDLSLLGTLGPFSSNHGVMIYDRHFYVSDRNNNALYHYHTDNGLDFSLVETRYTLANFGLQIPWHLTQDGEYGYLTDLDRVRVFRFRLSDMGSMRPLGEVDSYGKPYGVYFQPELSRLLVCCIDQLPHVHIYSLRQCVEPGDTIIAGGAGAYRPQATVWHGTLAGYEFSPHWQRNCLHGVQIGFACEAASAPSGPKVFAVRAWFHGPGGAWMVRPSPSMI